MNYAPDQSFLDLAINAGYQTLETFPDHAEFIYLLLSLVNDESIL